MANFLYITLDTTAPSSPQILLENGATFASGQLINANISAGDTDKTGFQMKIWGAIDTTFNPSIQASEANSQWITFSSVQQIKLTTGDGQKQVYLKLRDDVYNESAIVSDTITLDTTRPVVTVTASDVSKISKISGRNVASFSFTTDTVFREYKVKIVSSTGASHDTGTLIGTTNGSTNTSGTGTFNTSTTPINVSINGTDLELASAGDGQKIIKIFVKDDAGNWSA